MIEEKTGIPAIAQNLIHGAIELHRDRDLAEHAGVAALNLTLVQRTPEQVEWLRNLSTDTAWFRYWAPEGARSDRQVVLAAMGKDPLALTFASGELQRDRELVLLAVTSYNQDVWRVPAELWAERELVAAAAANRAAAAEELWDMVLAPMQRQRCNAGGRLRRAQGRQGVGPRGSGEQWRGREVRRGGGVYGRCGPQRCLEARRRGAPWGAQGRVHGREELLASGTRLL